MHNRGPVSVFSQYRIWRYSESSALLYLFVADSVRYSRRSLKEHLAGSHYALIAVLLEHFSDKFISLFSFQSIVYAFDDFMTPS